MIRITAGLAAFSGVLALLVWIAAGALSAAAERSVTYRYIAEALASAEHFPETVEWFDAVAPLARPITQADRSLIGRALANAWQALAVAQSTGRTEILHDVFTGVALSRAILSSNDAVVGGGRIAILSVKATPVFYHLDGSLFQAEVEMVVSRFSALGDTQNHAIVSRDRGIVTLMNESSGWRVFSYELRHSAPIEQTLPAADLPDLRGVNYYPAATPWREFWPAYDEDVIASDFALLGTLNANAVRVFLPRADFLDPDAKAARLADLADLLAAADKAQLTVIPTLFDLKSDYGPGSWAADAMLLRDVMPVLAAAGNVAFVDLKNEPDLDFEAHGRATVTAWLRAMAAVARLEDPESLLTVGWSAAMAAGHLSDVLDVITYHDYAPVAQSAPRLSDVRSMAGDKPVFVTEVGASSFNLAFGFPGSPDDQARALLERLSELRAADGVFVWTLHDFSKVDASAVGVSPWVQKLQAAFGLFDPNEVEKPAAKVVREAFSARAPT